MDDKSFYFYIYSMIYQNANMLQKSLNTEISLINQIESDVI